MTDSRALICPRCRTSWPEAQAPPVCPQDGSTLLRAHELQAATHDPMVGRTLDGRYTITQRIGAGSMGTVYRAKQHVMGREVAIKILRGDRAVDDGAKARFMREARANSLLASPNTVTVFDFGQSESGDFYLAMELLEGESLGQRLTRVGKLPIPVAVDVARQALRSLSEAHAKGIIHRDLKPDNIFFARVMTTAAPTPELGAHEEIIKVLDFGIAKLVKEGDEPMGVVETQAGTVFGTPRYMSPEQAQGKPLDARTDLYSLGVILFQMLTGRPPFTDNDAVVVMARHIKSMPKRPNEVAPEANIPRELEDVVMRTLAKNANDRQVSADVLASELLAALEAQGATTSGVRASLQGGAAHVRLPDSMRPPPVVLPQAPPPRSTTATVLLALPIVLLVAAGAVYLGMRSKQVTPDPTPVAATTSVAPAASSVPSAVVSAEPPPTEPSAKVPTQSVSALPTTKPAPTPHRNTGRPGTRPPPPAKSSGQPQAPTPPPSATSNYGVFD